MENRRNYVGVNAQYSSISNLTKIIEHNLRISECDYLLDDKYNKYKNIDNFSTPSGSGDGMFQTHAVSSGTYEENMRSYFQFHSNNSSSNPNFENNLKQFKLKSIQYEFYKNVQRRKEIQKKQGFGLDDEKVNDVIEFVIGFSEEQAEFYLEQDPTKFIKIGEEFQRLVNEKYGFTPIDNCVFLHTDEGHIKRKVVNKDGSATIESNGSHNYHLQIPMFSYDFVKERSVLRRLKGKKREWEKIQDLAEQACQNVGLDFIRGESKNITNKEHLGRTEFALHQSLKELKELFNTINRTKKELQEVQKQYEKGSLEYKKLNQDIKTLKVEDKAARTKYKELVEKVSVVQDDVDNLNSWLKDTKIELKDFLLENTSKNENNKFEIKDINAFYNEIVDLAKHLTNYDVKVQEHETIKTKNDVLKSKVSTLSETLKESSTIINNLESKLKNVIDEKDNLRDEKILLEKFIRELNLEDDFKKFSLSEKEKETKRERGRCFSIRDS